MDPDDPFRHHPELRGLIADPMTSRMRTFTPDVARAMLRDHGIDPDGWLYSDAERQASHARFLASLGPGDLWVFAYGSLIWDPGFRFAEVRRAYAPEHARRFILRDALGARGTPDRPGVMAALDRGAGCHGLAFRIAEDEIAEETGVIWNRERIVPGYHTAMIAVETPHGGVTAMTFTADHAAEGIEAGMTRDEVLTCMTTGKGFLGTSLEYAQNLKHRLDVLGLEDADLAGLLAEAGIRLAEASPRSRS